MIWRTDKPTEDVIVAKLTEDFSGGRYAILSKGTIKHLGKTFECYMEDFEEIPPSAIEKWASLREVGVPEDTMSEDLKDVANKYGKDTFVNECMVNGVCDNNDLADAFKAGAQWQKEQMMKDAIEVEVFDDWQYGKDADRIAQPAIKVRCPELKIGEKVKVLVIKE